MSKVTKIQSKIDEAQAELAEKVDGAQLKVQEAIDSAQERVEEIKARVEAAEAKVEGKIEYVKAKIQYAYDFVVSAIETAGVNPRNLMDIAKVVVGAETVAKPIVVPFLRSLVVVQVSEKPSTDTLKTVVEANI